MVFGEMSCKAADIKQVYSSCLFRFSNKQLMCYYVMLTVLRKWYTCKYCTWKVIKYALLEPLVFFGLEIPGK